MKWEMYCGLGLDSSTVLISEKFIVFQGETATGTAPQQLHKQNGLHISVVSGWSWLSWRAISSE